jgi:hypothetical protein
MPTRKISTVLILFVLLLVTNGCTPAPLTPTPAPVRPTGTPLSVPTSAPTPTTQATSTTQPTATIQPPATTVPFPRLSLTKGNNYFSIDNTPSFLYGRNVTGITADDFDSMLKMAHSGGTKILRIHVTFGWWSTPWMGGDGSVNPDWLKTWDQFFDQAEADGMYVMPVFGVWAEWNSGKPDLGSSLWQYNPVNTANGGAFTDPTQLFVPDSKLQTAWMDWLAQLVQHWQTRDNIAGWEIFSEVNIATGVAGDTNPMGGVSEPAGAAFVNRAAAVIRQADPVGRPVTASVAGIYAANDPWNNFYDLPALDFIEIHPYTESLDYELITQIGKDLARYKKPVMIGESGLNAYLTDANIPSGADLALQHAMWAGLVSGAMNGRLLWSEDGYAVYWDANDRTKSFAYMQRFINLERPAVEFVKGVDFTGYQPLAVQFSGGPKVWGSAVGSEKSAIAWFRDAGCIPPNWLLAGVISGQKVLISVSGKADTWQVDFYSTSTGTDVLRSITVARQGNAISVALPDFKDDIALKLVAK